jgi:hypothetical protein
MPRIPNESSTGSLTPPNDTATALAGADTSSNTREANNTATAWTPPVWLLGEAASKRPHGRLFRLSVPAVPEVMRDRIAQELPSALEAPEREVTKARLLRLKVQEQGRKQEAAQERLATIRRNQEQASQDVRDLREKEMKKHVKQVEDQLRQSFANEQKEKDQAWRLTVQDECAVSHKRALAELEDQEREKDVEVEAAKKAKLEQVAEEEKVAAESSRQAQEETESLDKEVETLNQNRLEIVWLLKRVIKAEEKQKASLQSKPLARTVTSKQA